MTATPPSPAATTDPSGVSPGPRTSSSPRRLVLIGGSNAHGLGVRGRSFGHRIRSGDGTAMEVLALTGIGRMIDEVVDHLVDVDAFQPDVAVLCIGGSERLVHPPRWFQDLLERCAPSGWHGVGGLQPRAYYSTSRLRRTRQRVVSVMKVAMKRAALRVGSSQRMTLGEFETHFRFLVAHLAARRVRIVVVGTWKVDERLFPGTTAAFDELEASLLSMSAEVPAVRFVAPTRILRTWDDYVDDRCHWNDAGHDRLAAAVEEVLAFEDTTHRSAS